MDDEAVVSKLDEVWRTHVAGDPREQLARWRQKEPDRAQQLSTESPLTHYALAVLIERFGLVGYRRARMRRFTVCVDVPDSFLHKVMWPMFEQMADVLDEAERTWMMVLLQRWSSNTASRS